MAVTLEVFYSFQSPYSYLALDGLYELQDNYDIQMLWQPFSAKASGQTLPASPIIPDKLSYLFEDTRRIAALAGLPLVFPEGWPETEFDPGRVIRGALIANDMGILKEYNYKVFQRWWGMGENPNDENFSNELCEELDIDLGDFLSKVNASDTRERVKGVFKRGRKFGCFDTPTIVIDQDRYYGLEKIATVAARLDKLNLRKKNAR
jgi:2-hydroxychromene-2-carboxylate isomerase